MKNTEIAPGILLFEDVLHDPKKFIKDLELSSELNNILWNEATYSDGDIVDPTIVVKSSRNCYAVSLPRFDEMSEEKINTAKKNFGENYKRIDEALKLHVTLNHYLNPALEIYQNKYSANIWKVNEGWQILKYYKDNYFLNHIDDSKKYPRTISMSYFLNDNYEGGEIEFDHFNLKIKPKENQAVFFPSNYVYSHKVHPVTEGIRYSVVGWWE